VPGACSREGQNVEAIQDESWAAVPRAPTVARTHSHSFTAGGRFGSRDWNGNQVDDGTYEIVDDHT
jgi:hypothetical protein